MTTRPDRCRAGAGCLPPAGRRARRARSRARGSRGRRRCTSGWPPTPSPTAVAAVVAGLRAATAPFDGTVVVLDAPPAVRAAGRRVGPGPGPGPDAPAQGRVRPRPPAVPRPLRRRDLMTDIPEPSPRSTPTGRRRPSWSPTACTAASACRPARPTCCGARRWTRPRGRIYLMQAGPRGRADDRRDGRALRRLPGLHGLRHRLPVRRAVRQADRGHPRAGRAPAPRARSPTGCSAGRSSRCSPTRGGCGCCAVRCGSTSAPACSGCVQRSGRAGPPLAVAGRDGGAGPAGAAGADRLPERVAARGEPRARSSGCSPAACSASSSPGQRRHGPGAGAEGCDVVIPRDAGLLRRAQRAQRPGGEAQRVRPADHRRLRGGRRRRTSSSTPPAAARR